ncbi:hypothetical protein RUM43_006514 [Polyplax serrata]|uniref:Uncharacterized protein n=1 Tax=Polyplax serrata TaxID=468196 RepID=A0AAN8NTG6_POLSC
MNEGTKLSHQEVAEHVLQIYTKALQDQKLLKSILSEFCMLNYFGKFFYEQEKVASHLISNFHGTSYELARISINEPLRFTEWEPVDSFEEPTEDELGVGIISSPKMSFPSLSLSTPVRSFTVARKRTVSESSQPNNNNSKLQKTEWNREQSNSCKKSGLNCQEKISPQSLEPLLPDDIKYLTAYGTVRYTNRTVATMDPKRMKRGSLIRLRDRFCQLHIGYECDEHAIGVTNCKIWTIRYSVSSRVTPRNLLNSFKDVET